MSSNVRALLLLMAFAAVVTLGVMWFLDGFDGGDRDVSTVTYDEEARSNELLTELRSTADRRRVPGLETVGLEGKGAGTGHLRGEVYLFVAGKSGRPLPGVKVKILGYRKGLPELHLEEVTNEKGVFHFRDVPVFLNGVLLIHHPPYREYLLRGMSVLKDRTKDVGRIRLGAPTSLQGEVLDARGRPVTGARVQVLKDRSRRDSFDIHRALRELQTEGAPMAQSAVAEDGSFRIGDLPPGQYVLRVSAPGFATTFRAGVYVSADENSTRVRIVLDEGAGYKGYVRDEKGQAVAGARIIAVIAQSQKMTRLDRMDAQSDAHGYYELNSLVPGVRYFISAAADGYASSAMVLTPSAKVQQRNITLKPSGRIVGRITDKETGQPIAAAHVGLLAGQMMSMSPVATTTNEHGEYEFPHVSPGPILGLTVSAEGYQQSDVLDALAVGAKTVLAGQETRLDWTLVAGGSIEGHVRARDGRPVPYATVAFYDRRRAYHGERTSVTGVDGSYRIVGLRAAKYEVRITAPGYAPPHDKRVAEFVMPKALGEHEHPIVIDRGAVIHGVVKNPQGEPQAGARIQLLALGNSAAQRRVQDIKTVTGSTGAYVLYGVPVEMPLKIVAEHDEFASAESARYEFPPGADQVVHLQLRAGISLSGFVVDQDGRKLEGARVRWGLIRDAHDRALRDSYRADELLGTRVVRSDQRGEFVVDGLRQGGLLLKVEHEGYATWYRRDLVITDGELEELRVELQGALAVSGRVMSAATGRALAGAYVYAIEKGPAEGQEDDPGHVNVLVNGETGVDGRFHLDGIPPRRLDVVVWFAPGHVGAAQNRADPSNRKRNVSAGASNLVFHLKPVGKVEGE